MSSHYVVFEDGRIVQCVPEERRAWHAGVSSWAGETDINSRSIGIEIVNPGHEFGYPRFSAAADRGGDLAVQDHHHPARADQRRPHPGHSDVAPSRKQDPGEKFPWELLSESGVGHWVRAAPLDLDGGTLTPGDSGEPVARLQRTLRSYGYGIEETGDYDDVTRDVVDRLPAPFPPGAGGRHRRSVDAAHAARADRNAAGAAGRV